MKRNSSRQRRVWKEGLIGLVGALFLWTSPGIAQEEQVVTAGQEDFQTYCAACHGMDGKGTGPMAEQLKVPPSDLSMIAKVNDGQFPVWRVYRVIEGTEPMARAAHGMDEMPLWGQVFKAEEGSAVAKGEAAVRGRIFQLIYYIQSIQAK